VISSSLVGIKENADDGVSITFQREGRCPASGYPEAVQDTYVISIADAAMMMLWFKANLQDVMAASISREREALYRREKQLEQELTNVRARLGVIQ
jgi:hypothetical protein